MGGLGVKGVLFFIFGLNRLLKFYKLAQFWFDFIIKIEKLTKNDPNLIQSTN